MHMMKMNPIVNDSETIRNIMLFEYKKMEPCR